jgi:hypothetical protein
MGDCLVAADIVSGCIAGWKAPEGTVKVAVGEDIQIGKGLRLVTNDDPRSTRFADFCDSLSARLPGLEVRRQHESGTAPPHLLLPGGVRYIGVPDGHETAPFMDAVSGRLPPPPPRLAERLAALRLPAALSLYVSPQCTFCPVAVRSLIPLATAQPRLNLTVIDVVLFPEMAEREQVLALPTLVIDGRLRWSGTIDAVEVVELLLDADPAAIGPVALEMMLKEGRAHEVASMMREFGRVFPALVELLAHDEWPVRLGAMVAAEELAGLDAGLAQALIDRVWDRFEAAGNPAKGDMLYLIGEIGRRADIQRIRGAVANAAPAEVREATEEAVEKIENRFKC